MPFANFGYEPVESRKYHEETRFNVGMGTSGFAAGDIVLLQSAGLECGLLCRQRRFG
jgi:hypothetical protein